MAAPQVYASFTPLRTLPLSPARAPRALHLTTTPAPRPAQVALRWLLLPSIIAGLVWLALQYPEASAGSLQAALLFTRAHPALVRCASVQQRARGAAEPCF